MTDSNNVAQYQFRQYLDNDSTLLESGTQYSINALVHIGIYDSAKNSNPNNNDYVNIPNIQQGDLYIALNREVSDIKGNFLTGNQILTIGKVATLVAYIGGGDGQDNDTGIAHIIIDCNSKTNINAYVYSLGGILSI